MKTLAFKGKKSQIVMKEKSRIKVQKAIAKSQIIGVLFKQLFLKFPAGKLIGSVVISPLERTHFRPINIPRR